MYRSGHNGAHSKCVYRATDTWVRIPPSPPQDACKHCVCGHFHFPRKKPISPKLLKGSQGSFSSEFLEILVFIGFPRILRSGAQMCYIAPNILIKQVFPRLSKPQKPCHYWLSRDLRSLNPEGLNVAPKPLKTISLLRSQDGSRC